jgi:Bacterial transglutaminase-like cysteine proteinase BTLCP
LRRLGVSADDLRIVVVNDRQFGSAHAILAMRLDDRVLILDNQTPEVVDASTLTRYEPYYSVNELGLWRYPERPAAQRVIAAAGGAAWPVSASGGEAATPQLQVMLVDLPRTPTRWGASKRFGVGAW